MKFDIEDILPSGEYDEKSILSFFASPQMTIGCYSTAFNSDAPNSAISKNIKIEDGLWRIDVGYSYDLRRLAEMELDYHIVDTLRLCHKKYAQVALIKEIEEIKEHLESCPKNFWSQEKVIKEKFSKSDLAKYMVNQIKKRTNALFNLYANEEALGEGVQRDIFKDFCKSAFSFDLFKKTLNAILKEISSDKAAPDYKALANHQRSKINKFIDSGDSREVVYFRYTHTGFANDLDSLSWSFTDLGVATSKYISVADKRVHSLMLKEAMQDDFSTVIAPLVNSSNRPFKCASTFGATFLLLPKPSCDSKEKLFLYTGKAEKDVYSFILTKSCLHVGEFDALLADLL